MIDERSPHREDSLQRLSPILHKLISRSVLLEVKVRHETFCDMCLAILRSPKLSVRKRGFFRSGLRVIRHQDLLCKVYCADGHGAVVAAHSPLEMC